MIIQKKKNTSNLDMPTTFMEFSRDSFYVIAGNKRCQRLRQR